MKYLLSLALLLLACPAYAWATPAPTPTPFHGCPVPASVYPYYPCGNVNTNTNTNTNTNNNNNTANGGAGGNANQHQQQQQNQAQTASANNSLNNQISTSLMNVTGAAQNVAPQFAVDPCGNGQLSAGLYANQSSNAFLQRYGDTGATLSYAVPLGPKPASCSPDVFKTIAGCAALQKAGIAIDEAVFPYEAKLCKGVHVSKVTP